MNARPRIDLDGVALCDEKSPDTVLAIFRHRLASGLMLLIPETIDVIVPWNEIASAEIDLARGTVRVAFSDESVRRHNWLRGASILIGRWLDRVSFAQPPADA